VEDRRKLGDRSENAAIPESDFSPNEGLADIPAAGIGFREVEARQRSPSLLVVALPVS
jgi:hypothetical protein